MKDKNKKSLNKILNEMSPNSGVIILKGKDNSISQMVVAETKNDNYEDLETMVRYATDEALIEFDKKVNK